MSGPSVPEAARAARTVRWGERFRLAQTKYSAGASRPDVAAALMALADAEVAAAVAEERATTGRRIEALATEVDAYIVSFAEPWTYANGVARDATIRAAEHAGNFIRRAALASPGEES